MKLQTLAFTPLKLGTRSVGNKNAAYTMELSRFTFFSAFSSFLSWMVRVFFDLALPLLDLEGFFLGGSRGVESSIYCTRYS